MPRRRPITWRDLARTQAGIVARRQLTFLGLGKDYVNTSWPRSAGASSATWFCRPRPARCRASS